MFGRRDVASLIVQVRIGFEILRVCWKVLHGSFLGLAHASLLFCMRRAFRSRYAVCLGALGLHVLEIARVGGLQQFGGEGSETTSGLLEIRFMGVG